MDEGSALLHHLEQNINQCLSRWALGHGVPGQPLSRHDELPCVLDDLAAEKSTTTRRILIVAQPSLAPEIVNDFENHLLRKDDPTKEYVIKACPLTESLDGIATPHGICIILDDRGVKDMAVLNDTSRWIRVGLGLKAATLVLVMCDVKRTVEASNGFSGVHESEPHRSVDTSRYPEWRLVSDRSLTVQQFRGAILWDATVERVTNEWLNDNLAADQGGEYQLSYSDIFQIFSRDLQQRIPNLEIFLRLFLMCVIGTCSVLFTLFILILLSKETGFSTNLRQSREYLRHYILEQRSGKSEWGWPHGGIALTALQLDNSNWCFDSVENQRSVDRMEIGLLVALSRLRDSVGPSRRDLTALQLAFHINALHATLENPKDFHGNDLVAMLRSYLTNIEPYAQSSAYEYSQYMLALCNSGVQLEPANVERMLSSQRKDGGFPLGIDEVSSVLVALSCFEPRQYVDRAIDKGVKYLSSHRQRDGSYGSALSTALVLQAFNATGQTLLAHQTEQSLAWLVGKAQHPSVKVVDVAAQVLVALSGKSLRDVLNIPGYLGTLASGFSDYGWKKAPRLSDVYGLSRANQALQAAHGAKADGPPGTGVDSSVTNKDAQKPLDTESNITNDTARTGASDLESPVVESSAIKPADDTSPDGASTYSGTDQRNHTENAERHETTDAKDRNYERTADDHPSESERNNLQQEEDWKRWKHSKYYSSDLEEDDDDDDSSDGSRPTAAIAPPDSPYSHDKTSTPEGNNAEFTRTNQPPSTRKKTIHYSTTWNHLTFDNIFLSVCVPS